MHFRANGCVSVRLSPDSRTWMQSNGGFSLIQSSNSVKVAGLNSIKDLGYTDLDNWAHKETVPVKKDGELIVADIGAMEPDGEVDA